MSFTQYPAYKDSGVPWLGEVPAHWDVVQVRHLARVEGGSTPDEEEILFVTDEGHAWATPADMQGWHSELSSTSRRITDAGLASIGGLLAQPGDILFSCRAPVGKVAIVGQATAFNQGCKAIIPKPSVHGRFLAWQLDAARSAFDLAARGTTFSEISAGAIRAVFLTRPPLIEQRGIAEFLDRETMTLDTLAAEQEALLGLLEEKRAADASHFITKGLNSSAEMTESGVPWVGRIPKHWSVVPLMRLVNEARPIMYGIVLPGEDVGVGIPIVKGGNVKPSRLCLANLARTTIEIEAPYARARLRAGDLVYAIRGTIGDCEPVPPELEGANITQDVARVAPRKGINSSWLRHALLSKPVREALACSSLGAAVRGVNIFDLKRVRIPVPPPEERDAIARLLDADARAINVLSAEARASIVLLRERRAALISAAVTGSIDVRAAASRDLEVAA